MIAQISFTKPIYITREELLDLGLVAETNDSHKFGLQDGVIKCMEGYWGHYYDECEKREDGKYYYEDKVVSSSYLYDRINDGNNYVEPKQNNQLVDLNKFAIKCRYPYHIEATVNSEEPTINNIHSILEEIREKQSGLNKMYSDIKNQLFNQKCDVHIGGGFIATYNELKLKENSCTDELQNELNDGWRIISVCVQPNQRRPDYVLGRYNPNLDVTCDARSAKR